MYVFLVWSYKEKVVICKTNVKCENRYKLGPSHGIPWALTMQLVIDICSVALLHSGLQNLNFLFCLVCRVFSPKSSNKQYFNVSLIFTWSALQRCNNVCCLSCKVINWSNPYKCFYLSNMYIVGVEAGLHSL